MVLVLAGLLVGCGEEPAAPEPEPAPDPQSANVTLVARYYEEVFNGQNLDFLAEAMHANVVGHGPGIDERVDGLDEVAAFSGYVYEIYDDYRLTVDEIFGAGDFVQVRATVEAIHNPTGRPVKFFGLSMYRMEDGKIAEYWRAYDRFDLYQNQLGGWRPGR